MEKILFGAIVAWLIVDFVLNQWLDGLNRKHSKLPLPAHLADLYPPEEYLRQQEYQAAKDRLSVVQSGFSLVFILALLFSGAFAWLHYRLLALGVSNELLPLAFFGVLYLGQTIIGLPFGWYATFKIETEFGFNRSSLFTFWGDIAKSLLLAALLGGGLLWAVVWLYNKFTTDFWWMAWAVLSGSSLLIGYWYSQLIVPLFNKQTPLPDGDLRTAIEAFAQKAGFGLQNIYLINGSKRSSKANAYFTGFGKRKRIVLYDTLLEQLDTQEIVAVLAHEIGHYKHKHVLWGSLLGVAQTGMILWLLSLMLGHAEFSAALGVNETSFHIGLLVFSLLFSPISWLLSLATNAYSRRNEFQADAFAASFEFAEYLASGLKKLTTHSLGNLMPHPWYVKAHYSHPPLAQRIEAMHKKLA